MNRDTGDSGAPRFDAFNKEDLERRRAALALDIESDPACADELEAVEAELHRRARDAERTALADQERRRRAEADAEMERTALLEKLTRQLEDLETGYHAALAELDVTPSASSAPLLERVYTLGRQSYSLAADLASVSGDRRRFFRPYTVPEQLSLHGGRAGEAFMATVRGHPPRVPTPWADDLARLRQLSPRRREMPSLT